MVRTAAVIVFGMMLSAAAPAQEKPKPGGWIITDLTDNQTGERTVSASAFDIGPNRYLRLAIECSEGALQLTARSDRHWPKAYFVAMLDTNDLPDGAFMTIWETSSSDRYEAKLFGDAASILKGLGEARDLEFVAYENEGDRDFVLDLSRTDEAVAKVAGHCRTS